MFLWNLRACPDFKISSRVRVSFLRRYSLANTTDTRTDVGIRKQLTLSITRSYAVFKFLVSVFKLSIDRTSKIDTIFTSRVRNVKRTLFRCFLCICIYDNNVETFLTFIVAASIVALYSIKIAFRKSKYNERASGETISEKFLSVTMSPLWKNWDEILRKLK